MRITLNGEDRDVAATTLEQALSELGYTESFVATAVNGCFIPKTQRRDQRLGEGDRIEVVAPMQGG
ncbi:sulfur carrier protein ThiS [Steroidobacter sp. S1-65]|uniref:Sulfur carrier protein ThiS n=1 Tax=Steroidobacter gossypii TaxID=2805490 RepID=A0ABS1WUL0_9GAMM|nr:sulfur carrier protein ThiS [Steroidobacter gossypii]MBM0104664.1 sulfur carrier protein ThiS [Steroidobacter gossypii]